jgi:hypothetical protein
MALLTILDNLAEGMVTAEPVFNHLGQMLLGKGVSLSARQLTVLKTWGIEKCLVEDGEPGLIPEVNEAIRTKARERIHDRIVWEPQNAWDEEIIEIAVRQEISRCLNKVR